MNADVFNKFEARISKFETIPNRGNKKIPNREQPVLVI